MQQDRLPSSNRLPYRQILTPALAVLLIHRGSGLITAAGTLSKQMAAYPENVVRKRLAEALAESVAQVFPLAMSHQLEYKCGTNGGKLVQ